MPLTIDELVAQPRWPAVHTLALAGQVRGDTLGGWGENLITRFGPDALAKVRRRAPEVAEIAPVLGAKDRVPVFAQLLLTEAIADEFLVGDLRALYPLILADTRAAIGRLRLASLRLLGPAGAFRLGPRTFRAVHERGEHTISFGTRSAKLTFRDNPLFEQPTWRVLQAFATKLVLDLAGSPGEVRGEPSAQGFDVTAHW